MYDQNFYGRVPGFVMLEVVWSGWGFVRESFQKHLKIGGG